MDVTWGARKRLMPNGNPKPIRPREIKINISHFLSLVCGQVSGQIAIPPAMTPWFNANKLIWWPWRLHGWHSSTCIDAVPVRRTLESKMPIWKPSHKNSACMQIAFGFRFVLFSITQKKFAVGSIHTVNKRATLTIRHLVNATNNRRNAKQKKRNPIVCIRWESRAFKFHK